MTACDELHKALYEYCVNELYSVPAEWRARSCWVMNREWYEELRAMMPKPELRELCFRVGIVPEPVWDNPTHLLGIPFRVTETATVPRLITD